MHINEIYIYEMEQRAEAVLSNGSIVSMDYLKAEREFTRMFEDPEKYDLCDIFKFNIKRSMTNEIYK